MSHAMSTLATASSPALIAGGLAVILFLVMIFRKKDNRKLPPVVKSYVPILGNFLSFQKPVEMVLENTKKYGEAWTQQMFGQNLTFLVGADAHIPFYRGNDEQMSQSEVYGFMTPVFGKGIVYDATPKRRIQQMQFMSTGLRTARLKSYVPKIQMEVDQFLDTWGESGSLDLLQAMSDITIKTASRCLLGDDVREQMFSEVAQLFKDIDGGITPLSFFFPNLPTPAHLKRNAARASMVELFTKVINNRRSGAVTTSGDDVLQTFMDAQYKDGGRLSDDQITGLLIALLFAGQHTSSITATWAALFISSNPSIRDRVCAETQEVLEKSPTPDGKLAYDHLSDLGVLHNCVKETLRMHPPLIMLMRKAMVDTPFKDMVIPKGHIVFTAPAASHRLSPPFTQPDQFDPDRFSEERKEDAKPFTFTGFGGGMHGCMGQQFAYVQLKTILSTLLRRYELKLEGPMPTANYEAMVVGPHPGTCRVTYKRR